jgi:hypothetical protein
MITYSSRILASVNAHRHFGISLLSRHIWKDNIKMELIEQDMKVWDELF